MAFYPKSRRRGKGGKEKRGGRKKSSSRFHSASEPGEGKREALKGRGGYAKNGKLYLLHILKSGGKGKKGEGLEIRDCQ